MQPNSGKKQKRASGQSAEAPRSASPATSPTPWRIRYSSKILEEDLDQIGHAALAEAKKAIEKKLAVDPHGYGDKLGHPLQGMLKLKSSKVRVVYEILAAPREVKVLMIRARKTIWKREQATILARLRTNP
jgi:mRNA-degrading endonuclease RelE of RelBE toxin-antitoxin system